jgi:hypothetical protein
MTQTVIGSWSLPLIPPGWEFIPQVGARFTESQLFPSNVTAVEEPMAEEQDLASYAKNQVLLIQRFFPEAQVVGPQPAAFPESEEAQELMVSFNADDGRRVIQAQFYVRVGNMVGVLTFTTIQEEIANMKTAFEQIRKSARFRPGGG